MTFNLLSTVVLSYVGLTPPRNLFLTWRCNTTNKTGSAYLKFVCISKVKPLPHLAALPLRLHGVLKFPRAPWDLTATLAFLRRSMAFLRRFSWRLPAPFTALPLRALSCHGARTACALRVHGATTALDGVLFTFGGS